jgi:hypothetical protein
MGLEDFAGSWEDTEDANTLLDEMYDFADSERIWVE